MVCAHSQSLVYRRKGWREEGLRKKTYGFLHLSISFYAIIFSISGWLIQGGNSIKRGCDRIPWLFVFLRKTLPFFCLHSNFWFECKAWFGAVSTHPPAYSVVFVTHLLCISLAELPCIMKPQKFCAFGALQTQGMSGAARNGVVTHIKQDLLCSHALSVVPSDLIHKHKFKVKIGKNFKTMIADIKPTVEPFWAWNYMTIEVTNPWRWPWAQKSKSSLLSLSFPLVLKTLTFIINVCSGQVCVWYPRDPLRAISTVIFAFRIIFFRILRLNLIMNN